MLLSLLAMALSVQDAAAPADQAAAAAPQPEKKICRREDSTGSRLGSKRICLTAAEWKERDRNSSSFDGGSMAGRRPTG